MGSLLNGPFCIGTYASNPHSHLNSMKMTSPPIRASFKLLYAFTSAESPLKIAIQETNKSLQSI